MTTPSRHPVAFDFFVEIAVIDQLVGAEMARVLPDGVSMASFSLLNHLLGKGGSDSPVRLAQALQVTKGAITAMLKRLEARGLVVLSADPRDGRGKIVSLTPEAASVVCSVVRLGKGDVGPVSAAEVGVAAVVSG